MYLFIVVNLNLSNFKVNLLTRIGTIDLEYLSVPLSASKYVNRDDYRVFMDLFDSVAAYWFYSCYFRLPFSMNFKGTGFC